MKERFNGYNRTDYYHPRSSREAFGSNFHVEKPSNKVNEALFYFFAMVVYAFATGSLVYFIMKGGF